ncbi:MAG: Glycosyl transferase, group 1 [uncultured bacterium]|nr:MAG: Glycosyl transferase, group 1 [uncultured bacterium]HBD05589.1 hypothetical protein [Candidatus Uhrbacteria bacterium]
MKKTLILTIDFPPMFGGVARYLCELSLSLHDSVSVLAQNMKGAKEFDLNSNINTERVNLFWPFWPHWTKIIFIIFKKRKEFDQLIISHVLPLGLPALFAKVFLKKQYILIMHGLDYNLAGKNAWKIFLRSIILENAKLVICNSNALCVRASAENPGINSTVLYPSPSQKHMALAEKYQKTDLSPHNPIRLLTVARLVPRKGHELVLRAISQLISEGTDAFYTIVGDGPEYGKLFDLARELNLEQKVKFERNASDEAVREIYKKSDLFVMPTLTIGADVEGFGIVYIEAASYGLPSIATDMPGVNESVINNETGLLIEEGDISALSEAIKKLATNNNLFLELSKNAKKRAFNEFQWHIQAPKIYKYL